MSDRSGKSTLSTLTNLDRLVNEPARLAIMALLYVVESADFAFVISQTDLSWGNLSAHISKLEKAGYLEVQKSFKGKRPNTILRLTTQGRESFQIYVRKMKKIFKDYPL